jgi:hypothetical protein
MKIKSSLDWSNLYRELLSKSNELGHNPDLVKMIKNVTTMIHDLSALEVEARRTRKTYYVDAKLEDINNALQMIKKYFTILKLTK